MSCSKKFVRVLHNTQLILMTHITVITLAGPSCYTATVSRGFNYRYDCI